MAPAARIVSLMARPGDLYGVSEGFLDTLNRHLLGRQLEAGEQIALPGWPPLTVQVVEPLGAEVRYRSRLQLTVPPDVGEGHTHLAILVDASLTMGRGESPTPYDRAATVVDAFLLNGRPFLASASVVVQGGQIRHVQPPVSPEELSGALIHQVEPKGTFDLEGGLQACMDALAQAGQGPRAILVVTDGDAELENPLDVAARSARAGTRLYAVADDVSNSLYEACSHTGGRAHFEPRRVFHALADAAGVNAGWDPPEKPTFDVSNPEFETVVDRMEEGP